MTSRFMRVHHLIISITFVLLSGLMFSSGPAQAAEEAGNNYFAFRGGLGSIQDAEVTVEGIDGLKQDFKDARGVSLAYGRRFLPWLRGELEAGWLGMKADKLSYEGYEFDLGDYSEQHFLYGMVNIIAALPNETEITPFVGAGLGMAAAKLSYDLKSDEDQINSDSVDNVVAYQFMGGLLWTPLSHLGIELRGRYIGFGSQSQTESFEGIDVKMDMNDTKVFMVDLGIRVNF
jgi:opacity protein-like surface antigen